MKDELRAKIISENYYYGLLVEAGFYPQGADYTFQKVIVGVSKVTNYKPGIDLLDMKSFDSWEDAYKKLIA